MTALRVPSAVLCALAGFVLGLSGCDNPRQGAAMGSPDTGWWILDATSDAAKADANASDANASDANTSDADRRDANASDSAIPIDDGGAQYNPCPPRGTPCTIMPLGDSITFGQGSTTGGGYREELFRLAHADGKLLTFVGSGFTGPASVDGVAFPAAHEGYPGITSGGLSFFAGAALANHRPHIVTLMIGTNDLSLGAGDPAQLSALIDQILNADPNLMLIVSKVIPTQEDARNARVETFNAAIDGLVQARAAAGKHIVSVAMYDRFCDNPDDKTAYLIDALHPNDAGYALMGRVWYEALAPLLR